LTSPSETCFRSVAIGPITALRAAGIDTLVIAGNVCPYFGMLPGFVYTVIADAPPQTVTQVVQALPRSGSPGVLERLGRGFIRIARVFNPFG